MKLDIKQQVLMAIYMEYQKDLPNMTEINSEKLGIEKEKFHKALKKLENEGFISKVCFMEADNSIQEVYMDCVMMTRHGIEYVEEILEIKRTSTGIEKLKTAANKLGGWGFKVLCDLGTKMLVEMGEKMIKGL